MIINHVLHPCKMKKKYIYIYIDFYLSQLMKLFTKKKKTLLTLFSPLSVNNLLLNKKYKNKISPMLKTN